MTDDVRFSLSWCWPEEAARSTNCGPIQWSVVDVSPDAERTIGVVPVDVAVSWNVPDAASVGMT